MYRNYSLKEIPIEAIEANPNQPRQIFDEEMIRDLSDSISLYGVMQPLTVRKLDNKKYELIAGERRLRAAKMAGLKKVPVIINQVDNKNSAVLALVENIQRENLNFIEESEAYKKLIDEYGFTQQDVADRVGKNQSTIANKLRLLKLEKSVRDKIREYQLTERHARALLKLEDERQQLEVLEVIQDKDLNVKKTEEYIHKVINNTISDQNEKQVTVKKYFKDIRIINNTIKQTVDMLKSTGLDVNCDMKTVDDVYKINITIPFKD
jgi:ParB family chromosome partitioning protein